MIESFQMIIFYFICGWNCKLLFRNFVFFKIPQEAQLLMCLFGAVRNMVEVR